MKEKNKQKKVGIQVDLATYNLLRVESKNQYRTITSLVRKVLNEYLQTKGHNLYSNQANNEANSRTSYIK